MSALIGMTGLVGFIVCIVLLAKRAKQKKPKKKVLIALGVFFALFVIGLALPSENTESEPAPIAATTTNAPESSTATETPSEEALSFELIAGEAGEYGELFTINKDTEFEETYYIYRIPSGTYTVTNSGEYMNQFNVCGDTVYVTDEGWEELSDIIYVKVLDVGESDTFTIEDGQVVEIHEPGQFLLEKN